MQLQMPRTIETAKQAIMTKKQIKKRLRDKRKARMLREGNDMFERLKFQYDECTENHKKCKKNLGKQLLSHESRKNLVKIAKYKKIKGYSIGYKHELVELLLDNKIFRKKRHVNNDEEEGKKIFKRLNKERKSADSLPKCKTELSRYLLRNDPKKNLNKIAKAKHITNYSKLTKEKLASIMIRRGLFMPRN